MWKVCRSPTPRRDADIGIQLWFANNRNRVRGAVLGLSQDGACTDMFENFSENSLKGDLSNNTTFKPPLFLIGQKKAKKSFQAHSMELETRTVWLSIFNGT